MGAGAGLLVGVTGAGGVEFALASLEVETVLTVSVVSANATGKKKIDRSRRNIAEVPVVTDGVPVAVAEVAFSSNISPEAEVPLASVASVELAMTSIAAPGGVEVANAGISHTSVKPTFLMSPSA